MELTSLENGKYVVRRHDDGRLDALRYGGTWRDLTGDKLVLALVQRIEELETSEDAARLDWLEAQAKESRTGAGFDYAKHVEDGVVIERGIRFMRFHFLGERFDSIRQAIDSVRK